jgi:hypothetical protein
MFDGHCQKNLPHRADSDSSGRQGLLAEPVPRDHHILLVLPPGSCRISRRPGGWAFRNAAHVNRAD